MTRTVLDSTKDKLNALLDEKTFRDVLRNLDVPDDQWNVFLPLLSDILNGRSVSIQRENLLRCALGLPLVVLPVPAAPCPTCGIVHGEGLDCNGQPIADVVILRPGSRVVQSARNGQAVRRPRKNISIDTGTWMALNEERKKTGSSWNRFLSKLVS